jgi:hypothetical protein
LKRLIFIAVLSVCAYAAEAPVMFNYRVFDMVKQGVPTETIISAIRGSQPRFDLRADEVNKLTSNGVSQAIIDAMTARQMNPNDRSYLASSPNPARAPRERPEHWGMTPGMPEVGIGGGVSTTLPNTSGPFGVFSFDGAVGINRYVAGIGSITRHSIASDPSVNVCSGATCAAVSGKMNLTEALAGLRVSGSNSSRVTPFMTGLLGVAKVGLSGEHFSQIGPLNYAAFYTKAAFGAGGGVEINATRSVGFRTEVRAIRILEGGWYGRVNTGVFFRFGR